MAALGLPAGPVVLLFGGAGKVAADDLDRIRAFVGTAFIPAMERIGGIVIDGGTDAGVMRIAGEERVRAGGRIRMVGVAPFGKVRVPGSPGSTALAQGHTDFVLVPGTEWGSEVSWFHLIADRLARGTSVTVLVNGGPIALDEIDQSIDLGRRVIVVDGTGRAATTSRVSSVATARAMDASNRAITVVDVTISPTELADELARNPLESTDDERTTRGSQARRASRASSKGLTCPTTRRPSFGLAGSTRCIGWRARRASHGVAISPFDGSSRAGASSSPSS